MAENKQKKGNFMGLMPLIIFLVLYFLTIMFAEGGSNAMPLMIGITIASIFAFIFNRKEGEKRTFEEKVSIYCRGGGEETLILMVLIFLLAGAFYSVANNMGARDSVVNLGLDLLPSSAILPGLFIIGCVLSFSMGTSMGTVNVLMPVAVGLAPSLGVSMALVGGIVAGGAMFGDNLSFISDTTIAATRTQDVSMKSKFRINFLMILPAVIVNVILLAFVKISPQVAGEALSWSLVSLIPYILVIVLSLMGLHVIITMGIGIMSGVIIGVINGDFTLVGSMAMLHTGMTWMEDMALIAVLVGGLVALMKDLGGIDWLLANLTKGVKGAKGGQLAIAALVSLLDLATTNNTISIIAAGPIAADIGDKYGVSRPRIAALLDLFAAACNGISPIAGQLLVAAAFAGISPVAIVPYVWYCFLMIAFGILFILIGWPKDKAEA